MRTFGLTGGIGSGKSTAARMLREHGIEVFDADQAARAVVEPGSEGLAEIAKAFGPEVLQADGSLDRAAMRRIVMADADARATLEAITHPRIFVAIAEALRREADRGATVAGVEAALMVETGSYAQYDLLVVVSCSAETQIARVMARDGGDEAAARRVLAAQLPLADKAAKADVVLHNDHDLSQLQTQVDALAARLLGADQ